MRTVGNILDVVHDELAPNVWDNPASDKPTLKPVHAHWITQFIFGILDKAGYTNPEKWLQLVLTGSLTTYQYGPESDCDVSLFVNASVLPEWSRSEMIGLMIDSADGVNLPGTSFPMQMYVVSKALKPEDLYKPGLRSGYDIRKHHWIEPPDRGRSHNVEQQENGFYVYALEQADKMERLLRYEPDKAVKFWHQIHQRRQRDQQAGKGDFAESNIVYKFLANRGLMPAIAQASGEHIAHVTQRDSLNTVGHTSRLQHATQEVHESLSQSQSSSPLGHDDEMLEQPANDHTHNEHSSHQTLASEWQPASASVVPEYQFSSDDFSRNTFGNTDRSSRSLDGSRPDTERNSSVDRPYERSIDGIDLWAYPVDSADNTSHSLSSVPEENEVFPQIAQASGEHIAAASDLVNYHDLPHGLADDPDLARQRVGKSASGERSYYHVAPASVRDQIEANGPQQYNPSQNPAWSDYPGVHDRRGLYVWNTLDAAQKYRERLNEVRQEPHDIWEVPIQPAWLDADPELDYNETMREYGGQSLIYPYDEPLPGGHRRIAAQTGWTDFYHVSPTRNRESIQNLGLIGGDLNRAWDTNVGDEQPRGNYLFHNLEDAHEFVNSTHGNGLYKGGPPKEFEEEDLYDWPEYPEGFHEWEPDDQDNWHDENEPQPRTEDPDGWDIWRVNARGLPIHRDPEMALGQLNGWTPTKFQNALDESTGDSKNREYGLPTHDWDEQLEYAQDYHGQAPMRSYTPESIEPSRLQLEQHVPRWNIEEYPDTDYDKDHPGIWDYMNENRPRFPAHSKTAAEMPWGQDFDEWNASKPDYASAGHQLGYDPALHQEGKGFILQDGSVWTWPTAEMQPMHMAYSMRAKKLGVPVVPGSAFHIERHPNMANRGKVWQYGQGRELSLDQRRQIFDADNRLVPWRTEPSGAVEADPYGHATRLVAAASFGHQDVLDQNAGQNLEGLPGAVNVPNIGRLQFNAHGDMQRVANEYNQANGFGPHPTNYSQVNPAVAQRLAAEYEALEHNPNDPEVAQAYNALKQETLAQYQHAVNNGYKFEFYPEYDPYPNSPREAVLDLHHNKHMYVYPTVDGFGSTDVSDHPLMEDSGVRWNGVPVTHNDLFRAIHDFYGHAKEGLGFRATGEDNAYRQHQAMFSPLARRALASETRGQNSWVNYGPYGEQNQTAKTEDTVFAPQKAALMPEWATDPDLHATAGTFAAANYEGIVRDGGRYPHTHDRDEPCDFGTPNWAEPEVQPMR